MREREHVPSARPRLPSDERSPRKVLTGQGPLFRVTVKGPEETQEGTGSLTFCSLSPNSARTGRSAATVNRLAPLAARRPETSESAPHSDSPPSSQTRVRIGALACPAPTARPKPGPRTPWRAGRRGPRPGRRLRRGVALCPSNMSLFYLSTVPQQSWGKVLRHASSEFVHFTTNYKIRHLGHKKNTAVR